MRFIILIAVCVTVGAGTCWAQTAGAASKASHRFEIGDADFLLDGKPFIIRSGEMHAARVPREYWEHRLQMVRAMGCNTVCAYLFWNQHEPAQNEFVFTGAADCAEYCRLAQKAGLFVILRPGPYACAEWDMGGLPAWLLKTPDIKLRSRDPRYFEACQRYLLRVGKELAPLQVTRGGPILMVQVENEYGSYGDDKEYIGALRDDLREAGFDVPLFTCDGARALKNDARDDLFSVVNFGSDPEKNFAALRAVRAKGPLMCGEYYPGWFDSWGLPHHTGDTAKTVRDLGWMLEHRASFSIYMVHGGTSFGFSAGANSPPFRPQTTSYDYDAPIDEAGRATPKFHALRELFGKHLNEGESLPPIPPPPNPTIRIPPVPLTYFVPLFMSLPTLQRTEKPEAMEFAGQFDGIVLYRRQIGGGEAARLRFESVHDHATVYLDAKPIGTVDRRRGQQWVELPKRERPARLDILVDTFGRVNFGRDLTDRKGLLGRVDFVLGTRTIELRDWSVSRLTFDTDWFGRLEYQPASNIEGPIPVAVDVPPAQARIYAAEFAGPALFRGSFTLEEVGDTFLDMSKWSKGVVWVNGQNLGRYWSVGPQQTLYLPGCWLRKGRNDLFVLELQPEGVARREVGGLNEPILDQLRSDPFALPASHKPGQSLKLDGLTANFEGEFAAGSNQPTARFPAVRGRYVCVEAVAALKPGEPVASCAELEFLDAGGKPLPREGWTIAYADSEELVAEDGRAANVLDGDPATYWHSQWEGAQPGYPHQLVIDLGATKEVAGLRCTPRPAGNTNGNIRSVRLFVNDAPFPGL